MSSEELGETRPGGGTRDPVAWTRSSSLSSDLCSDMEDDANEQQHVRPPLSPTAAGRPPRMPPAAGSAAPIPPPPPLPRPDAVRHHHDRLQSAGEFSFLSALTEDGFGDHHHHLQGGTPPPPTTAKQSILHRTGLSPPPTMATAGQHRTRDRAVSFDQHVMDHFAPRLPSANPDTATGDPSLVTMPGSTHQSPSTRGSRPPLDPTRSWSVRQVNPLEYEAETAILRAVEKAQREEEAAAASQRPLRHLPEEGVQTMLSADTPSTSSPPKTVHSSSPSQHHHFREDKTHTSNDASPLLERPMHRRGRSNFSMANRNRTESIEATLFDLTTAMRAMNDHDTPVADGGHTVTDLAAAAVSDPPVQDMPATNGSADALVQNANLLFRRNVTVGSPRDESSIQGPIHSNDNDNVVKGEQQQPIAKPGLVRRFFSDEAARDPKKTDHHLDEKAGETGGLMDVVDEMAESSSASDHGCNGDIEHGVPQDQPNSGTEHSSKVDINKPSAFRRSSVAFVNGTKERVRRAQRGVKEDWEFFTEFMSPLQASINTYCKTMLLYIMLPSVGLAAILFYGAGNPLLKRRGTAISWLILFLVRQIVTFSLAKATELFVIDFMSLRSRLTVRVFGPTTTLFLVQSKGFPFILFMWGLFSLCLLSGASAFAQNWLYWQDAIDMCNENNPSGDVPSSEANYRILVSAMIVGVVVATKRVLVGLYLGKRTLSHFGDQLAKVIQSMILVSEVAQLGNDFEPVVGRPTGSRVAPKFSMTPMDGWDIDVGIDDKSEDDCTFQKQDRSFDNESNVIDEGRRDERTGNLSGSQRIKMMQLLEDWEEPEEVSRSKKAISINAILQFRQALAFMDAEYPFSYSFGYAGNREACIESAQRVYRSLMRITPEASGMPFDTIATLATAPNGDVDHKKMRALIKIFRPDRNGHLSMLQFVRSCDGVYKEVKLLRAAIANSGQIDNALETMLNVAFYTILTCLLLAVNGFNPLAIFLSFSSVILAFAFMIGSASSKYFEGILFILIQRPYSIGDLVAIAGPNSDTAFHGAIPWYVLHVNLFTTTIKYAATGEVATVSNGALSSSRIINGARSPAPINHVYMKFGVDVPYSKVQLFHKAIESFVKERPREWVCMHQFRATQVVPEQGYIEYVIVLQHREKWQEIGDILMSKSDMASYVLEVSKQLDMRYHAPAMPVDLSLKEKELGETISASDQNPDSGSQRDAKLRALSSSMFAGRRVESA